MSTEMLFEAITLIDSDLIDEAERFLPPKKRPVRWKRWTALAACLALVIGAGFCALPRFMLCGSDTSGNSSGSLSGPAAPGNSEDAGCNISPDDNEDAGSNGDSVFLSYAGPVLPLTALDGAEGVTAQREITLDFLPWAAAQISNEEDTDILVTDSYTLSNQTAEERTMTVLYPFVSSLLYLEDRLPVLTAGGNTVEVVLHAGAYTGGFTGVYGDGSQNLWNMVEPNSWEEYAALLEDGRYQAQAMEDFPDLSGTPVILYEFTDYKPNTCASFTLERSKTAVLACGFRSICGDDSGPSMQLDFPVPQSYDPWNGHPGYLLVLGEDIADLTIKSGALDDPIEDGAAIRRYEIDLESALRTAAELMYRTDSLWSPANGRTRPDFELYFGLMKEYLLAYGPLAEDGGIAQYSTGWLAELDCVAADRVFYLEAQVTVPAGESVELTAQMRRPASYNSYCAHTENQGVYGYDLVTRLGSALTFTGQTATLEDRGVIKIVRQNFGFDLEQGVKTVELDQETERCYLEVRFLPPEE